MCRYNDNWQNFFVFLSLAVFSFIPIYKIDAAEIPSIILQDANILQKDSDILNERFFSNLEVSKSGLTKVWVFFTDKGFTTRNGFEKAALSVSVSDKTALRRSKVGLDGVLFADIPVSESYVQQVISTGAAYRRSSRWLNAASFEVRESSLPAIAALPSVASIKPLGLFRRDSSVQLPRTGENGFPEQLTPDEVNDLRYGNSFTQLQQIGVPELHRRGLTGKGVTLAIFDTGFRKSHEAFTTHFDEKRVLAEFDFIFNDSNTANEPNSGDALDQWNHGTSIWSTVGGSKDGTIFGPAFNANFILCKTEDVRSETPVEEDNWVAALEWVESLGADVVTSSLGYIAWYSSADMDGNTAIITIAANMADSLGIVVCNAIGNFGSRSASLIAPADAHNILACGAVNGHGLLASFSSRGPTADGRIKPEVVAMGVNTFVADATDDNSYRLISGTSLSTPLVAGVVCQLIEARPAFTPTMIRRAIIETASMADLPDNDFGYGVTNAVGAVEWGVTVSADTIIGEAPFTVQFTGSSLLANPEWLWSFGDGETSTEQNPIHLFDLPGSYSVSLTVNSDFGQIISNLFTNIVALGDTLKISGDSTFAGKQLVLSVSARNSQVLNKLILPVELGGLPFALNYDSATTGMRTINFNDPVITGIDIANHRYVLQMTLPDGGSPLPTGSGEVMQLFLTIDRTALGGLLTNVTPRQVGNTKTTFGTETMSYPPFIQPGWVATKNILRGDADYSNDGEIDITDLTYMIAHFFLFHPPSVTLQSEDVNADQLLNLADIQYLIDYLFLDGPPPETP